MPQFFATCPKGLSSPLTEELNELGVKRVSPRESGVSFETSWAKAYEVNVKSKVASRVVKPVLDFDASSLEQIVPSLKRHDFSKYLNKSGTFSLRVKLNNSKFNNQKYIMNEIRVGLLNQFKAKGREDITVDREDPDLEIVVQVYKNTFSLSLNMSGAPLSNRGYREDTEHAAPLRENLAAGLVRMTGWTGEAPLVDFLCGSGTFLIEAANSHLQNQGPFSFVRWANFDESIEIDETKEKNLNGMLYGFDRAPESVNKTKYLIKSLGLESKVNLKQIALKDFGSIQLPETKGTVILNPPYGERLGSFEEALKAYELIGETLKKHFSGWDAWILSPDVKLSKAIGMSAHTKYSVDNGGISCMFLGYKVN